MGGFLGSPWNFIFLEEFGAAGGARISLNSLCGDMERSHSPPHAPPIVIMPLLAVLHAEKGTNCLEWTRNSNMPEISARRPRVGG